MIYNFNDFLNLIPYVAKGNLLANSVEEKKSQKISNIKKNLNNLKERSFKNKKLQDTNQTNKSNIDQCNADKLKRAEIYKNKADRLEQENIKLKKEYETLEEKFNDLQNAALDVGSDAGAPGYVAGGYKLQGICDEMKKVRVKIEENNKEILNYRALYNKINSIK
jgi:hypothetical protein